MKRSDGILWGVAALLFLALVAVAVIKAWPLLYPEITDVAPFDSSCDLRAGQCTSRFSNGAAVRFAISPKDIPLVKPLKLDVEVSGVPAKSVEVDFIGIGMDMGFNRPKLESLGDGKFSGTGVLPVCIRKAMEWEAKVLVTTDGGMFAAPYRFITVKPGVDLPKAE